MIKSSTQIRFLLSFFLYLFTKTFVKQTLFTNNGKGTTSTYLKNLKKSGSEEKALKIKFDHFTRKFLFYMKAKI